MRITVVSTPVFSVPPSGYSGLEMVAWLCAKGLAERGHRVKLVAPDGSSCPGVEIVPCGRAGHWHERQAFKAWRDKVLDAEAIIDHGWQKMAYALKAEGRFAGPVLGVLHAPADTMYRQPPPVAKPCFVCISEDQAAHLRALMPVDARVCRNGVDSEVYRPLGVPRSGRFLFLARFSALKGPSIAIETCIKAGVGLDLVGDFSITQEPDYFRYCQQMCDGKQVRMIGPCSRGETVWWYSQAKALLHPIKLFREPFGLAPVESQMCGTPVISWKNGATSETIRDGETGLLVRSEEEMLTAIRSDWIKNLTESNRQRCREWALQFSIENMVERYEQLCQEALGTGGW